MNIVEMVLKRKVFGDTFTKGDWYINGELVFHSIEDKDRGLKSTDTLEEINRKKVDGKTAIPTGKYNVQITYSPKFKCNLPLVEDVKGFEGIRIHRGNSSIDTEGCLLPVMIEGNLNADFSGDSKSAFNKILNVLNKADKATIEVISEKDSAIA